ncbi:Solute carrier organic anion transporter family member 2B1 [Trichinella pseudospiralis]|uniref:Solute carrier organic anion transporter family member n=1 Tax=Trichinella pseudospiralis TaxID=6337 RepID=A0A0V1EN67_TRIPS|nr:Solute carrier organic anion transporter family member 2B1 [Trichinella pseudospiralis]
MSIQRCIYRHANISSFLCLFCICFALETASFTLFVSALQSIERHFQIPSKLSGTIVSAGDIGYILTVVLLAYVGSKGNRAKWIGSGCILISLACIIIALPYFIFPYKPLLYNETTIKEELKKSYFIREEDIDTPSKLLKHKHLGPRLPNWVKDFIMMMQYTDAFQWSQLDSLFDFFPEKEQQQPKYHSLKRSLIEDINGDEINFEISEHLIDDYGTHHTIEETYFIGDIEDEIMDPMDSVTETIYRNKRQTLNVSNKLQSLFSDVSLRKGKFSDLASIISKEMNAAIEERFSSKKMKRLMSSAQLPFAFCNEIVTSVKAILEKDKCKKLNTDMFAVGIIGFGIVLIGIGHSMPWTLGIPLIDDNANKNNTPLYFAVVFFTRVMGPALGFILGAGCNKIYLTLKEAPGITVMDKNWIGAWWLGFLLIAFLLLPPSIGLLFFPRIKMKKINISELQNNESAVKSTSAVQPLIMIDHADAHPAVSSKRKSSTLSMIEPSNAWAETKKFLFTILIILRCPVFIGSNFGRLIEAFAMKGMVVFQPKYLENHFGLPQFVGNLYLGITGVLLYAIGVVLGSIILKRFKLNGRKAAAYIAICSLISGILTLMHTLISCHSVINSLGKQGLINGFNYTTQCNIHCHCDNSEMFPVCDRSGSFIYYSPCHAGCRNITLKSRQNFQFEFHNCDCISNGTSASRDWCKDDCYWPMITFFVLSSIVSVVSGSVVVPSVLLVLRSVPVQHRSVALGFSACIISLISTMPAPTVYGHIFDSACLIWNKSCEDKGNCTAYNPDQLRFWFFGLSGALKTATLFSDLWVWYWAKDLQLTKDTNPGQV